MLTTGTFLCKPFSSRPPSWAPSSVDHVAAANTKKRQTYTNFDKFKTKENKGWFKFGIASTELYLSSGARHRRNSSPITTTAGVGGDGSVTEFDDNIRKLLQAVLWVAERVYICGSSCFLMLQGILCGLSVQRRSILSEKGRKQRS